MENNSTGPLVKILNWGKVKFGGTRQEHTFAGKGISLTGRRLSKARQHVYRGNVEGGGQVWQV